MPDDVWVDVFENIDEIVDYFKDIQKEVKVKLRRIENAIENLDSEVERSVLTMHYLEGISFRDIEKRVPYSERSIYRYHAEGLEHLHMPEDHD